MRKTKLAAAVSLALAGSAGVVDSAQAVNVNPDNLGEVLIYPYYTARDGYDTLISVVNTRGTVKAVKVRILEGKNSQEVLDFNLYLSPHDVWTGSIVKTENGAKLTTKDNSCTVPAIPEGGVAFRRFEYAGQGDIDGAGTGLDRTREGYLEIIEMGVITNDSAAFQEFNPARAASHVNGEPRDCSVLRRAWAPGGIWSTNPLEAVFVNPLGSFADDHLGGLKGQGILINVEAGTDYSYTATALNDFFLRPVHTGPGSLSPSLSSAQPVSNIYTGDGVERSDWLAGQDAVSAVLMHDTVINTFVTDPGIGAGTDWVVTFPTKRFYINIANPDDGEDAFPPVPPFTQNFWDGACEPVNLAIWNREEAAPVGEVDFSPLPPSGINALCWEVNVITFNESSVLDSALELNVDTGVVGENGWMRLGFYPTNVPSGAGHRLTSDDNDTYHGLPVVGFALHQYVNETLGGDVSGGVLSNYSGLFEHAATQKISGLDQP